MVHDEPTSRRPSIDVTRRKLLGFLGGGAIAALAGKAGYEYTGFGTIGGTNLVEQDLDAIARRNLSPTAFDLDVGKWRVSYANTSITVGSRGDETEKTVDVTTVDRHTVSAFEFPIDALVRDLGAIESGDVAFDFGRRARFFHRLRGAERRPLTVAALRGSGYRQPAAETVEAFADADPGDVRALHLGLADGFRRRSYFDVPRYLAGTIDRVRGDDVSSLESRNEQTAFDALLEEPRGMYCYEYALRSVEAFHAKPPRSQTLPVFAGVVIDVRHDHAYTLLASVIRDQGDLVIPVTFLDYFYATVFDTFGVRWAFGEGIGAYDRRHRATRIHYANPYI